MIGPIGFYDGQEIHDVMSANGAEYPKRAEHAAGNQ
jgi:hypothetical protein